MAKATKIVLAAVIALCVLAGTVTWLGNREASPPTLAEQQASYQRAVAWMRANEAVVLKDGNSALWWMIQTAAERTGDDYLKSLVRRSLDIFYDKTALAPPWKRIVDPNAEVTIDLSALRYLEPYQRFLSHAVTCQPVVLDDGSDSNDFLERDLCHPMLTQVYRKDPVCTTHQLIGVKLFQRSRCTTSVNLPELQSSLLADITEQMHWDNAMMKDAYIQRVLVLYWVGGTDQAKPIWMRRVLTAQQPDGGWVGTKHVPELPAWLQPWALRSKAPPTEFHATAQGLLLAALAISAEKPH